jgi:hypothetical protein
MLYVNYEEALLLQDGSEPMTTLVAVQLSGEMTSAEHRSLHWLKPQWPFDMRYFYGSICRLIAGYIGHSLTKPLPLPPPLIRACVPDLGTAQWLAYDFVTMGLADRYLAEVHKDSVENGSLYDVTFALHVAGRALDRTFIETLPTRIEFLEKNPPTGAFDEWLAGFNSPSAG